MENLTFLMKLGLSEREGIVYLALLSSPAMGVSEIARSTKLQRTQVYDALGGLTEQGLIVTSPKGKYMQYSAESPKKLEKNFLTLSNTFDEKIESLTSLQAESRTARPVVKYFEGVSAISSIHDDIVMSLKKGDTYRRYSSSKAIVNGKGSPYLSKKYRLVRDAKELERKVITNVPNKIRKKERLERTIKTVPTDFDLFEYNVSQVIYGDKIAVIDYNTDTAVVIENAVIAKFQEKIFELLFRKL